ncbi:helix-turn-helix domain-containing protein [Streptomyces rubradiris]|uniref:Uncharacterized protein n=1 Tax=Streptomyces rubradiris TaxID=285531 RepID=A0ABQ3RAE1_STRRR|nr:helix-turn-helix domain-containing protein [Streptomyces rubradiris]GHH26081.1 hypothetical protein GCM10018792_66110 [Streptomyces rubradiris]GHI52816.1 hypothetical protein Srubr_26620 [Streptomyces rubradiris]
MSDDFDPTEVGVYSSDAPPLFTMVPEWITYSDLKAAHKQFWTVLASCVNRERPDNLVWPAGPELADAMGIKKPEQLKPYREALESIGAIVPDLKRYANGMRQRYVYDVRFHPPADYTGPRSRTEWLARRKKRLAAEAAAEAADTSAFESETAGQAGTPKNGGTGTPKTRGAGAPKSGRAGAPETGGAKQDEGKPDEQQPNTAPSARSAGNGRRPTTGSRARGTSSGSAAANGATAPKRRSAARSSREVLVTPEVQAVLEAFPDALREALVTTAGSDRPRTVVKAIEQQLVSSGGGLAQARKLGKRVARRWVTHGYTQRHAAGTLKSPVGATLAMLKPGPCPRPDCEDGELEDGTPCRTCIQREKDRRAKIEQDRQAKAAAREAEARRRACPHCGKDRGTDGQPCADCSQTLASLDRDTAVFLDQALARHLTMTSEGDPVTADDLREHLTQVVIKARQQAAAEGLGAIGQALAGRLAADGLATGKIPIRRLAAKEQRVVLGAPADRPDPAPEVRIPAQAPRSDGKCPGPDGQGCPHNHDFVGFETGLCFRCRAAIVNGAAPSHS